VKNEHLQAHHTEYTQKYGLCEHVVDQKVTGLANCADDGMRQIRLSSFLSGRARLCSDYAVFLYQKLTYAVRRCKKRGHTAHAHIVGD